MPDSNRTWHPLGTAAAPELAAAREQLHQAAQLVAAVARSYHEAVADDHFANLEWMEEFQALVSQVVASDAGRYQAGLRFHDFAILLIRDNEVQLVLSIAGKTQDELISALRKSLETADFDGSKLAINLPYEIPEYETARGATFTDDVGPAFAELGAYFSNADLALRRVEATVANASEVRCWPHHFDIATLITLRDTGDPETSSSIGVGLSPGDGSYQEPYFYIAPWPYPDQTALPQLAKGHWHTEGFTAAILKGSEIVDASDQESDTENFIDEVVKKLVETLS